MIQIRNVLEDLHRKMKSRAALAGMSLSGYLLDENGMAAERPTVEEFQARLAAILGAPLPTLGRRLAAAVQAQTNLQLA